MGKLVLFCIPFLLMLGGEAEALSLAADFCSKQQADCFKNNPGSTSCVTRYDQCINSQSGSSFQNGNFSQDFNPYNKDYQACSSAGDRTAVANCIARRQRGNGSSGSSGGSGSNATAAASPSSSPSNSATTCPEADGSGRCTPTSRDFDTGTDDLEERAHAASAIDACMQQMQSLVQSCRDQNTEATNSCDENKDSTMSSTMNTLQQASAVLGQATASSVQAACSKMASVSQAANAATAAYEMNCSSGIGSCTSACQQATTYWSQHNQCLQSNMTGLNTPSPDLYNEARDLLRTCQSYNAKTDQAKQAIQNYILTAANASNCSAQSSATGGALPDICKTNPTLAICTKSGPVDCTKPEMASNKVCICSKTPNDPACLGVQSASNNVVTNGSSAIHSTDGAPDLGGGDMNGLPTPAQGTPVAGGSEASLDGKQGGSAGLGGSDGLGGGGSAGKGAVGKDDGKGSGDPYSGGGFYGGGSGSAYGGGVGSGSDGSGGGLMGRLSNGAQKAMTDLRKFLPGGQYDPKLRGVAGTSGPDGITGPHSNIWQKVQNRYQVLAPTLMP